jgi:hypothetical protein
VLGGQAVKPGFQGSEVHHDVPEDELQGSPEDLGVVLVAVRSLQLMILDTVLVITGAVSRAIQGIRAPIRLRTIHSKISLYYGYNRSSRFIALRQ